MGKMIKMPLFEAEKLEYSINGNHRWLVVLLTKIITYSVIGPQKKLMSFGELFW